MNDNTLSRLVAMVCLTIIWVVNSITWRLDGALLTAFVGAIAGLGGYEFGLHHAKKSVKESEDQA